MNSHGNESQPNNNEMFLPSGRKNAHFLKLSRLERDLSYLRAVLIAASIELEEKNNEQAAGILKQAIERGLLK